MKLYLAGGLFNAGERLHALNLEKHLVDLGYEVILPQREALRFFKDGLFDIRGIVDDCRKNAIDPTKTCVCSSDGADADSGTAIEFGMAITATGKAIVYRTDFRTALEKEVGVNAMFRANDSVFIYEPCFFTELKEVDEYYKRLAAKIDEAIVSLKMNKPSK
jgi:nucleoside 2-deoxyribosyltransferase